MSWLIGTSVLSALWPSPMKRQKMDSTAQTVQQPLPIKKMSV